MDESIERERLQLEKERLEIEKERNERERTQRTFTILQRERRIDESQRNRNISAVMFGITLLAALASVGLRNVPSSQIIQEEIDIITSSDSWGALFRYFRDIGVMPITMVAASIANLRNMLRHQRAYNAAIQESEDFNSAAAISENNEELGGDNSVITR